MANNNKTQLYLSARVVSAPPAKLYARDLLKVYLGLSFITLFAFLISVWSNCKKKKAKLTKKWKSHFPCSMCVCGSVCWEAA